MNPIENTINTVTLPINLFKTRLGVAVCIKNCEGEGDFPLYGKMIFADGKISWHTWSKNGTHPFKYEYDLVMSDAIRLTIPKTRTYSYMETETEIDDIFPVLNNHGILGLSIWTVYKLKGSDLPVLGDFIMEYDKKHDMWRFRSYTGQVTKWTSFSMWTRFLNEGGWKIIDKKDIPAHFLPVSKIII